MFNTTPGSLAWDWSQQWQGRGPTKKCCPAELCGSFFIPAPYSAVHSGVWNWCQRQLAPCAKCRSTTESKPVVSSYPQGNFWGSREVRNDWSPKILVFVLPF